MRFFFNPDRIAELMSEDGVRRAAKVIMQYANRDVLLVLVCAWLIVLAMSFSLILTVRLALSIPLWHG